MFKRYLIALMLLITATVAHAVDPPPFDLKPMHFNPAGEILGNGVDPNGGEPPFYAWEPADIPSEAGVTTNWLKAAGPPGAPVDDSEESKIRILCNFSHDAWEDPALAPGSRNFIHLHRFFGNTETNRNSTYNSLRTTGTSSCIGGKISRQAYWRPQMMKDNCLVGGTMPCGVNEDYELVYYTAYAGMAGKYIREPRGAVKVFGKDPSDMDDNRLKDAIEASNTSPGYPFSYPAQPSFFFQCSNGQGGTVLSDDEGVTPAFHCHAGDVLEAFTIGPDCVDGYNLTSPDGRSHYSRAVHNAITGLDQCPDGWFRVPTLTIFSFWTIQVDDEHKNWYWSSDRMVGRPRLKNGASGHNDWAAGQDNGTPDAPGFFLRFMGNCAKVRMKKIDGSYFGGFGRSCSDGYDGNVTALYGNGTGEPTLDGSKRDPAFEYHDWIGKGILRYAPIPKGGPGATTGPIAGTISGGN